MAETKQTTQDALKGAKKTGKTHLMILMDESGSMMGLGEAVVTGCNEFLYAFRDNKKARVWLAFFDYHPGEERVRFKVKAAKVADVPPLTSGDYRPRGCTPLNDAILAALSALDERVAKDETVFMAIITDGYENASEASEETVREAIKRYEGRGWAFVYIGANQRAESVSTSLGLGATGQAFNFKASRDGVSGTLRAVSSMAMDYSNAYATTGSADAALAASMTARSTLYDQTGGVIEEDLKVDP